MKRAVREAVNVGSLPLDPAAYPRSVRARFWLLPDIPARSTKIGLVFLFLFSRQTIWIPKPNDARTQTWIHMVRMVWFFLCFFFFSTNHTNQMMHAHTWIHMVKIGLVFLVLFSRQTIWIPKPNDARTHMDSHGP